MRWGSSGATSGTTRGGEEAAHVRYLHEPRFGCQREDTRNVREDMTVSDRTDSRFGTEIESGRGQEPRERRDRGADLASLDPGDDRLGRSHALGEGAPT